MLRDLVAISTVLGIVPYLDVWCILILHYDVDLTVHCTSLPGQSDPAEQVQPSSSLIGSPLFSFSFLPTFSAILLLKKGAAASAPIQSRYHHGGAGLFTFHPRAPELHSRKHQQSG